MNIVPFRLDHQPATSPTQALKAEGSTIAQRTRMIRSSYPVPVRFTYLRTWPLASWWQLTSTAQRQDSVKECPQLRARMCSDGEILACEDLRCVTRLDVVAMCSTRAKHLCNPHCRWAVEIDVFRVAARRRSLASRKASDHVPVRQEPCFEVVLCCMREELLIRANPQPHLCPGIGSILKVVSPRVDIREGDDRVGSAHAISQQPLHLPPKLGTSREGAVKRDWIDLGHAPRHSRRKELSQMRNKRPFRITLDQKGNSHARPPIRPKRHTSSRVYSASQRSRSRLSAQAARVAPPSSASMTTTSSGRRNRIRRSE